MLKKENRLTIFSLPNPKNISTPLFNLKIAKNNSEYSRFGFIASKKVSTSAVVRNSVKRKIRSIIEENINNIDFGWSMAFYLKKEIINADRTDIEKSLLEILKKENIYHV